ncbi:hypothetical protein CDL12_21113 [Handroanthus impetiginosus]|uniref:Uncharacterized protein n=1 Tax=Handroanthus impetiginosus TaxID=429701 RepID=A0A2G9GM04_9LAMI|nr:hypothetical protein CDL12_21113 [Handroanthus impetiginosus]
MEKETDIDDILNYRSVAEHELEDFLVNPSSRYRSNDGNSDKSVEDDRAPSKPRGWLNWLSYGMLGAGGTDDSNQFSGVISDDVIKDIYEATKFHPAPVLIGDSAAVDEVYFSSVKINIREIRTTFQSIKLGRAIADLTLEGISIEGKVWEKSAIITASVNSALMLNPFNSQVVLSTKKPALSVIIDLSPPSSDVNSSVKVILNPAELCCDSEFVKNIVDIIHALQHLSFQQQRILLSLNGIDDLNSRLVSKIDCVLSSRKKMKWDVSLLNTVINIPWENANVKGHNMVIEVTAISFASRSELDPCASNLGNRSHLLNKCVGLGSGSSGDTPMGFQLQDLYDHFEIQINDIQMKLMMPSSATTPLFEKFSASANLAFCILPDESSLKGLEVCVRVPSLVGHFSASIYLEIMGLISQLKLLLPSPDSSSSLGLKSNGSKTCVQPWLSVNASMDAIYLLVNLEEGMAGGCTLNLHCQGLGIWFDRRDFPECWASVEACQITASSTKDDRENHVLCSTGSMWDSGSVDRHNIGVALDGQNGHLGDGSSVLNGCIILHFEVIRNAQWFLQKYTICTSDLDIHCYPSIVGRLIGFLDQIVVYEASDIGCRKPDVDDGTSSRHCFELQQYGLLNEVGSNESGSIPLEPFPFSVLENLRSHYNLENTVDHTRLNMSKTLYLRDQEIRHVKLSLMERLKMFSAPPVNGNINAQSSIQTYSGIDLLLVSLNLGSTTVHFHDSSYIVGTISVPLAKSLLTVSADSLDIVCSTEGVVLSSTWWSQMINEFLWGPLSSNLSPVLNLHLKKRNTDSQNSQLEMGFHIQHVSCMLLPDFLAMVIGYFSLPDWSPRSNVQPPVTTSFEDSSTTFNFKIVDCNVITPANSNCSEFLKVNVKQLCVDFSQNRERSSLTKNIPAACCIGAGKFSERNSCLDFFGYDLSLSLLLLEKDGVDHLNRCQSLILVASLSADVWVRIPYELESDETSSFPICIMAMVNDCQLDVEEASTLAGFKALSYAIDQLSLVDEESKIFTSDVLHFLQTRKQLMESLAFLPTSEVTFSEIRFCVRSLSLRLHRLQSDTTCSEVMGEAEMHFVCSLSLMNGQPQFFDISFSSLTLFSFLNSVVLAEFASHGSGSSVLDMILSVSDYGENQIVVSFPSLDVWLHLSDWNEVIDVLCSFGKKLSLLTLGASAGDKSSPPVDNINYGMGNDPNRVASAKISHETGLSTLKLEHVGLAFHLPALVDRDTCYTSGRPHFYNEQLLDECSSVSSGHQNCFLSVSMECRDSALVAVGKTVKLTISSENLNGVLKLFIGNSAQTWPLFQLSKIYLEAEIFKYETEDVHVNFLVRCDSMDLSLSNYTSYLFHFKWFQKSEETPAQFNIKRMDLKVQLRKFSVLLTDWKLTSNGPLLEFLMRNSTFRSTITGDEMEGSIGCDFQVNYYSIDKVLWEPFVEPWTFQLSMRRKQDERALFTGAIMTDIILESKRHLNLNLNESIIEVASRATEMIKDAWSFMERTESPDLADLQITNSPETRRYAPYMLQNLTTLPLVFHVCQREHGADDLDVSPSKGVLQPGSSTLVYINESPEELLFRYRPGQSSDKLNDKQLLEAAHRYVTFQLEGTSVPSAPISMDLVCRRYFEVEFSKSSHVPEVYSDANSINRSRKGEADGSADAIKGFAIPVVIDVSVQRFTKLMRLYSTVVILNATSALLEVRFDIPFGVSPKILGPIRPGQEFPLPLHLAEAGYIRWRPIGDSYLWSEAYNISSIISQDVRIGFLRSFVCYPSHPSSEAFRCCISVNDQCLPPVGEVKGVYSPVDVDSGRKSHKFHGQSSNNLEIPRNRFLYQVMLTSPLVLKNYLMNSISVTLEDAGVTRTAFLSEV